jgi:hypothetical protein
MWHAFDIDLLIVTAIVASLLILLRPDLLIKRAAVRYVLGGGLLILGIVHLCGYALLSIRPA